MRRGSWEEDKVVHGKQTVAQVLPQRFRIRVATVQLHKAGEGFHQDCNLVSPGLPGERFLKHQVQALHWRCGGHLQSVCLEVRGIAEKQETMCLEVGGVRRR